MLTSRQKRNKTGKNSTAIILSVVLLVMSLAPGCGSAMAGDFAENGKQDPVQVFDSFARDLFVELASQDELSLNYTLADPQVYGITKADSAFSSYSVEEMEKDRELDKEILNALKGIKEDELTEEQRITYRILTEMLKGEGAGKGLELYEEPLNTVTGMHLMLPVLLAEYRFYGKQNVDTYLGLLEEIDVYYNELLEFEKKKAEEGLFMSDRMADKVVESCRVYIEDVEGSLLDEAFQERLEELPEINGEEKAAYIEKNRELLK